MNRINTKQLPRTQMAANRQKTCQMQKVGLSAHTGIRAGGAIYVDVDGKSSERNFL